MRGVAVFISGLFVLTLITMFSGAMLEPILEIVATDPAVQSLGWATYATDITDTINRWIPLLYIAYLLVWSGMWYLRKERMTGARR